MTGWFTEGLRQQRLLPVLRADTADAAVDAALTAVDVGLGIVELTATTPGWDDALRRVQQERPGARAGLGTVTTERDAHEAVDCGAAFLVSPWPCPAVREVANGSGTPFLEGAFSPGELADAAPRGPVKLFPAHVGGPAYLRSLRQLLPDAAVVPTGGIALADVPVWVDAGALAVGVGSDLLAGDVRRRVTGVLDRLTATPGARA